MAALFSFAFRRLHLYSRHRCLLSFFPFKMKKTRLLSGAGLRVVQSIRITCPYQVAPRPGVLSASPGQLLWDMLLLLAGCRQKS